MNLYEEIARIISKDYPDDPSDFAPGFNGINYELPFKIFYQDTFNFYLGTLPSTLFDDPLRDYFREKYKTLNREVDSETIKKIQEEYNEVIDGNYYIYYALWFLYYDFHAEFAEHLITSNFKLDYLSDVFKEIDISTKIILMPKLRVRLLEILKMIFTETYLNVLLLKKKYNSIPDFLKMYCTHLSNRQLVPVIIILHYYKIKIPLEVFAHLYTEHGGTGNFEERTYLDSYLKIIKAKELNRDLMFNISKEAFKSLFREDRDWFNKYMNKMASRKETKQEFTIKLARGNQQRFYFHYKNLKVVKKRFNLSIKHEFSQKIPMINIESFIYHFPKNNQIRVLCKNAIRTKAGLPLVGSQKVNETRVYNLICSVFKKYKVEREYSHECIKPQRYDYFIDSLQLAIEWNGEQHYYPVEYFGGEKGYEATIKRDERKRSKSKKHGILLIELAYYLTDKEIIETLLANCSFV